MKVERIGCHEAAPPRATDLPAWTLLGATLLLIALLELWRPLPIAPLSLLPFVTACTPLVCIALFYSRIRPQENLVATAQSLLQMLVFSALGCVLQYLLAREGGALWDASFVAMDRSLGLDWLAYVQAVEARPALRSALTFAYAALISEAICVVLILGMTNRLEALRIFVLAGMMAGGIIILLSPIFPSTSCFVFLGLTQEDFRNVHVTAGYAQNVDYQALRDGTFAMIHLPKMQGIIAFPSYHASLATVNAWGFWKCGKTWLRVPGISLALGTIASAPIDGGHYFVDVLAGLVIAIPSMFIAKRLVLWKGPALRLRALPSRRSREAFAR